MPKKAIVEGDVILRDGNRLDLEPYEAEFILSDDTFSGSSDHIGTARIIIKKGLLQEHLRKQYDNYKGERASQVVRLEDTEEETSDDEHGLGKLILEATRLDCIPENIQNYRRPDYKAKALEKAIAAELKRRGGKGKKKGVQVVDEGFVD